MFLSFFELSNILKKKNYDFIFTSVVNISFLVLVIKKIFMLKSKIFVRESNIPDESVKFKKNFYNYFNYYLRKFYKYSNYIICPNFEIFNYYKNKKFKNLIVLFNPINIKKIKHLSKKKIDKKFLNKKYILFLGNNKFQKNLEFTINTFNYISKKITDLYLIILGKNYPTKHTYPNKLFILGLRSKPYKYIKNSDLVISTSRWEGMPNSILESLALNKKVFVTKFKSGPKDIISLGGKLKVCNSLNHKDFSEKLYSYLNKNIKINNSKFLEKINNNYENGLKNIKRIIEK